jgi:hypothetical protein
MGSFSQIEKRIYHPEDEVEFIKNLGQKYDILYRFYLLKKYIKALDGANQWRETEKEMLRGVAVKNLEDVKKRIQ